MAPMKNLGRLPYTPVIVSFLVLGAVSCGQSSGAASGTGRNEGVGARSAVSGGAFQKIHRLVDLSKLR
jgi:hypothetical protein